MFDKQYYSLQVTQIIDETSDAKSLVFDIPAAVAEHFAYQPGQFLTLRFPHGKRLLERCYSLCSTPGVDAAPRITVKRVDAGRVSNWICDNLKPGDTVEVLPPAGVFTPKSLDEDFLLFAGGSGITPVFSILKAVLLQGRGRVQLIYANHDLDSVIFRDEIEHLCVEYPDRLSVHHWLDSVQGHVTAEQLAAIVERRIAAKPECFICGPGTFMKRVIEALDLLEVPHRQIHIERFVSLDDEDVAPAVSETGKAVALEVELEGKIYHLVGSTSEVLLETMLKAGLDAPYSCRGGGCAACMCLVKKGEAEMRKSDALDPYDAEVGWVLSCQAEPRGKAVKVSFSG